jgi:hypothetical protein
MERQVPARLSFLMTLHEPSQLGRHFASLGSTIFEESARDVL